MQAWNLYIFDKIKPLWFAKSLANLLGFCIAYPFVLYNKETEMLLSIFLAAYLYRTMSAYNNDKKEEILYSDFAVIQILISLFCACLFMFDTWQDYGLQALCGCIFVRLYDYYKPSLIGRFYAMEKNRILGSILGAILHGILSSASVMLLYWVCMKFL